ncbi:hypothetical protein OG272_06825 [Streptomyces sp. NBC_00104]|uniref:hypothetical protein n=1 Tax=Streptomyces sp. NBC_00104 TaxID=2903621 RepID=UPI0032538C9A
MNALIHALIHALIDALVDALIDALVDALIGGFGHAGCRPLRHLPRPGRRHL